MQRVPISNVETRVLVGALVKHKTLFIAAVLATAALAGCADTYRPIVDTREVDQATYERDLAECREYARRVDPAADAAKGGVVGGAIGAAVGAVIGALTGNVGRAAAIGAAGGATGGVLRGGLRGGARQKRVIRRCLRGRGYQVLD
jgi:outer membrane lipoprotein SlyB